MSEKDIAVVVEQLMIWSESGFVRQDSHSQLLLSILTGEKTATGEKVLTCARRARRRYLKQCQNR